MDTARSNEDARAPGKKTRRQFAFYPNMNSSNKTLKPFSRSAAKRESVMALGSIEHLQYYFTTSGIAADKNPLDRPNNGMVPAIGGPSTLTPRPSATDLKNLKPPPSPAVPRIVPPAYVNTVETDPEHLRPGVIEDLVAVASGWRLSDKPLSAAEAAEPLDVLALLKTTTRMVRSVRNYLVSLPDDTPTPHPLRPSFRPQNLPGTPLPRRNVSQPHSSSDPLGRIRRSALDVLTVLRELEASSRLPLEDDAYDAQSDHGDHDHDQGDQGSSGSTLDVEDTDGVLDADATVSFSFVNVGGMTRTVPVWEDDADAADVNHLSEEERSTRARWDERLVLGGGWLYRQDVRLADVARENGVVARYVDVVDEVLFEGTKDGRRGWVREKERMDKKDRFDRDKGRRVSTGTTLERPDNRRAGRRVTSVGLLDAMRNMAVTEEPEEMDRLEEEDYVDDDDLPEWAKRTAFEEDPMGRLHALLSALLPTTLLPLLPPASGSDHVPLLQALSSGQLLCVAYNIGVRRSRKPWGYISKDAIHDIAALEAHAPAETAAGKRGWTFRRTDNLRLWSAALRLRYLLAVTGPGMPRSGRSTPQPLASPLRGSPTPLPPVSPGGMAGSPTPTTYRFPGVEMPLLFDPPLVARQDVGWQNMLEALALQWMHAVVDERRGER